MKEYELLREEMMENIRAITQYAVILYAAVTAVFAFAIESNNFLLYLITYFIVLPLHFATESKHYANCKIAAYLYVFLEGGEFNWEQRHQKLEIDNSYKRNWKSHFFYYAFLIVSSIFAETTLIIGEYTCTTKCVWGVVIPIVSVTAIGIMKKTSINYIHTREKFITEWQKLKKKDDSKRDNKKRMRLCSPNKSSHNWKNVTRKSGNNNNSITISFHH